MEEMNEMTIKFDINALKNEYYAKNVELKAIINSVTEKNKYHTLLELARQLRLVMNNWMICIDVISRLNEILIFYGLQHDIDDYFKDISTKI